MFQSWEDVISTMPPHVRVLYAGLPRAHGMRAALTLAMLPPPGPWPLEIVVGFGGVLFLVRGLLTIASSQSNPLPGGEPLAAGDR